MKKIFYLFLSLLSLLWSIDLDIKFLEKSVMQNPNNIGNMVLLAKYYIQGRNYSAAELYLQRILRKEPHHKIALKLQKETKTGLQLQKLLPHTNFQNPFEIENNLINYFNSRNYTNILEAYRLLKILHISITPLTHLLAAEAAIETGQSELAQKIWNTHKLPQIDRALALQTYFDTQKGNLTKVYKNLQILKSKHIQSPIIDNIEQLLHLKEKQRLQETAQNIHTSNSFQALQDYIYLLNKQNKKTAAIRAVKTFLKKNPNNFQARVLLVKLYYWNGDLNNAFHKLYSIRKTNSETRKLYANILYERGDYTHALVYLPQAVQTAQNAQEHYNLKKRLAFAYAYTGKKEEAKKLFGQLLQQHPNDHEIKQFQSELQKQNLLQTANSYYRQKAFSKALEYYKAYFDRTNDPKIAKEIAEIYYFTQHRYADALPFYKIYLDKFPDDTLIRFHYASALEKVKQYKAAATAFGKITTCDNIHLCHLARYHESYALMKTQEENDWLKARVLLKKLLQTLELTPTSQEQELKKFVKTLYKTAQGKIRKPTYYKDIVLTEGSKKDLDIKNVFANIDISNTTKPSLETLLDLSKSSQKIKPSLQLQMDYVHDSEVRYRNYQVKIANLLTVNGIRYSASAKKYLFTFDKHRNVKGKGFTLHMHRGALQLGIGVKEIGDFNTLVPELTWSPVYGVHNLYFDLFYQNGAFVNYRNCMIKNKTNVLHAGIYDRILMDNFDYTEVGLSLNAFEDGNVNAYAMLLYPFYNFTLIGLEHRLLLNENIDYNSKTDVCYSPAALYDSTYLIYNPKITFNNGSLEVQLGKGYSFKNRENISSYVIKGDYRVNNIASVELNCERVQSSFTSDDIDYCTFNIIQEW